MGTCHYMNYQHIEHAQVVALVGRGENDRAHAEAWGLPLYDSVTEANRLEQIDLFDVCVPTYLHKAIVLEALACKKPVICEKPIALHLKDAQEMFDAAQANGVQLYVAQVLQFTVRWSGCTALWTNGFTANRWTPALSGCLSARRGARETGCLTGKRAAFCRLTCMCTIWM